MVYGDEGNKEGVWNGTLKAVSDGIEVYFYGCKCLLTVCILV